MEHDFKHTIERQREYFFSHATKEISFRLEQLDALRRMIVEHEREILLAVKADLKKPDTEAYTSEIGYALNEISCARKHLKKWARAKPVKTAPINLPARTYVVPEPQGVVLIIGPWNYPFQLVVAPLVGAIAAGNCAVLKPSEVAGHTSSCLARLFKDYFSPAYIAVVEGGVEETQALLAQPFDHIFYTGNGRIGRLVMKAASEHLTPVTLELGGKNPCIVESDADLSIAAREIAWGKFFNAGQTCIAPDYLLVQKEIGVRLIQVLKDTLERFYGLRPQESPDYGRIINARHFNRIRDLLKEGKIEFGGESDEKDLYIAPTLVTRIDGSSAIMQEEIFGPVLPILEYESLEEALGFVRSRPRPLVVYCFSKDSRKQKKVERETSSGGIAFNATLAYLLSSSLPFGGVGESGIGKYHGKASFDRMSHGKSVLKKSFWLRHSLAYPPYSISLAWMKRMFRWML